MTETLRQNCSWKGISAKIFAFSSYFLVFLSWTMGSVVFLTLFTSFVLYLSLLAWKNPTDSILFEMSFFGAFQQLHIVGYISRYWKIKRKRHRDTTKRVHKNELGKFKQERNCWWTYQVSSYVTKAIFYVLGLSTHIHTLKRANTTSSHRLANEKLKIIARTSNQLRSMNTTKSAEHSICKIHLGICVYMDFLSFFYVSKHKRRSERKFFLLIFFHPFAVFKKGRKKELRLTARKKATKRKWTRRFK